MVDKNIFHLVGMPRAGNTVLGGIINQNPDLQVSPLSPLCRTVSTLHQSFEGEAWENFDWSAEQDSLARKVTQAWYSDSKANQNASDGTADESNAIGHGYTFGYDLILTPIISSSLSLGYSDSDAKVDAGNDYETYEFGIGLNFAFPWAYIAWSASTSFNDYKAADTTVDLSLIHI